MLLKKPFLDLTNLSNYHPVSDLPFLGTVIEKTALEQSQTFLENRLALDPFLVSFHPDHRIEIVLIFLTIFVCSWIEAGCCYCSTC